MDRLKFKYDPKAFCRYKLIIRCPYCNHCDIREWQNFKNVLPMRRFKYPATCAHTRAIARYGLDKWKGVPLFAITFSVHMFFKKVHGES